MILQPRRPIGYAKRKALAYAADIVRLNAMGHSLTAIREALEDVGVHVSNSTVRREVLKGASTVTPRGAAVDRGASAIQASLGTATSQAAAGPGPSPDRPAPATSALPGKSVAQEFMRGRPANTLFLKEPPP